ncbi:type II secretion system protein GspG [Rugamonas aquatica]|uniref:Uncharacterized protein n=1 Tax=Rugamonas aquatica TaxID=2743357 RepID=A0A6A7N6U7_9BURK|nr:type II secretion system protein GspG [Rugamonas aquatica]MQA40766.1 hypothetical protein [Rugamonas aquatica]
MYAIVVSAMLLALASALSVQAGQNFDLMRAYRANAQRTQLVLLAEHLEQYYLERGAYPAEPPGGGLAALTQTPGYEQVRSLLSAWQGYALSAMLTDGVWRYQRMVAYAVDPSQGRSRADYLAVNACGAGGFATAASWCGASNSVWFRKETRQGMNDAVSNERARLRRTLQKLGDSYSSQGAFPARDHAGIALAAGTSYTLAALVGYGGGAAGCRDVYVWRGVPLGCEDLFDAWGGAVGLAFTSDQAVSLISETPLVNAAGTPLVVAAGFTM